MPASRTSTIGPAGGHFFVFRTRGESMFGRVSVPADKISGQLEPPGGPSMALRCDTCGHVGAAEEIACRDYQVCPFFALRQLEGKLPAGAPIVAPIVYNTMDRAPTEAEYDQLRARLDEMGIRSMEYLVETRGMDAKTAGRRVAEFNDLVVGALRRKFGAAK